MISFTNNPLVASYSNAEVRVCVAAPAAFIANANAISPQRR